MIDKIVEFILKAGIFAVEKQQEISLSTSFKAAQVFSVVTNTDIEVSRMFKAFVEENFGDLNYIIIDEETLADLGDDKFAAIEQSEYQFVIDPIDGTHPYALEMPEYGISVGVLKNGVPYLGAVYLPASDDMLYNDDGKVYWLKNSRNGKVRKIELKKEETNDIAMIFGNSWFAKQKDDIDFSKDTIIDLYSAVVHLFYIATNKGKGYYFGAYIWDMAGSWMAMKLLGVEFRDYVSGDLVEKLDSRWFDEKLKIKNLQIVSREKDFEHLREIVELRKKAAI